MGIFNYDKLKGTLVKEIEKDMSDLKIGKAGLYLSLCDTDNYTNVAFTVDSLRKCKFGNSDKSAILYFSFNINHVIEYNYLVSILSQHDIDCSAHMDRTNHLYNDDYSSCDGVIKSINNDFPDIIFINRKSGTMKIDDIHTAIDKAVYEGYKIKAIVIHDILEFVPNDITLNKSNNNDMDDGLFELVDELIVISNEVPVLVSRRNTTSIIDFRTTVAMMLPIIQQSSWVVCMSDHMKYSNIDNCVVTRVIKNRP